MRPAGFGERDVRAHHAGVGARLDAVPVDPQLVPKAGQDELAAEDADRAGDRARLGDDGVGRRGDEVPAGRRDIRHGDDQRLAGLARPIDLAPDRVGGDIGAARAVDPQDDRRDAVIGDRIADRFRDGVRSHDDGAEGRVVLAGLELHRPEAVDDRDPRRVLRGRRQRLDVVVDAHAGRAQSGAGEGGRLDLVPVAQAIHQAVCLRLTGEEGAAIDEGARRLLFDLALGRDAGGDLPNPGVDQALQVLADRFRHAVAGEDVHRPLVLLALIELRLDADTGQRLLQERAFKARADEPDRARRLQPDLVEGGGEVVMRVAVAGLAEGFREGDGELAALAEGADRVAQLLCLRHLEVAATEPGHQALDTIVAAGCFQRLYQLSHHQRVVHGGPGQRPFRSRLDQPVPDVEDQHRLRRNTWLERRQVMPDDQADGDDERRQRPEERQEERQHPAEIAQNEHGTLA